MKHQSPWLAVLMSTVHVIPVPGQELRREFELDDPADLRFGQVAGDLDRDGVLDLFFAGDNTPGPGGAGVVRVLSGRDHSEIWRVRGSDSSELGRNVARMGDLDADGHDDLAIAIPGSARIRVYSGLDASILLSISGGGMAHQLAAAGDLDGDGVPDLWTDWVTTRVAAYSGATGLQLYTARPSSGSWTHAAPGKGDDLDGDGVNDLFVSDAYHQGDGSGGRGGGLWIFSGVDGGMLFEWLGTEDSSGVGTQALRIGDIGDLDGDGRSDFAYTFVKKKANGDEKDRMRFFTGLGAFHSGMPLGYSSTKFGPVGDFDLDGRVDHVRDGSAYGTFDLVSSLDLGRTLYRFGAVTRGPGDGLGYHWADGGHDLDGNGRPNLVLAQPEFSTDEGRVADFDLQLAQLWAMPRKLDAGQPLVLQVAGARPHAPVEIALLERDGVPMHRVLVRGRADAEGIYRADIPATNSRTGRWVVVATTPTPIGAVTSTNREVIEFE